MATLKHSQSRRMYSWWWDSHISPKNSKWLQENLTDMDSKVKAMIKLIEEDADSFARRAEMYYKKRPELMKMVEEFYRAYRALAERYDHATGALRQAHSTMAQAFPNQIPPVLTDDSPSGSSGREVEPHSPETPSPIRSFCDRGDSDKDAYGTPSRSRVIKRNGAYSEENNRLSRKGLKQLNDIYLSGEGEEDYATFHEEVRKGLRFEEDLHNEDPSTNEDAQNEIKRLQEALALLSMENQTLKNQKASESERADKAENDAQNSKNRLSEVTVEKDDITLEYQKLIERISSMEAEFSRTQDEFKKHNEVTAMEVLKLVSTEKRCTLLDKAYKSLQVILEAQEQKMKILLEENSQLSTDNWNLKTQITSDSERADKAESEVQSAKDSLSKLIFETEAATLQYQRSLEAISYLEGQFSQIQDESMKLSEEMLMQATKLNTTEERCLVLEKEKRSLQRELENVEQEINVQQEVHNQLSTENEKLKSLITTECDRAQKAEVDLQSAKSHVLDLTFEKEAVIVQYQQSLEMISRLQTQVSQTQNDYIKLNEEMVTGATKLSSVEEQCLLLNKANQSLKTEANILKQKIRDGEEVFSQLSTVISNLKSQITSESENACKAETEVQSLKENLNKLNIENESCIRQYQQSLDKISNLEAKISQAENDFKKLSDDMVLESMKSRFAEEQCCLLEKANQSLKLEVEALEEEKKVTEEQVIYQRIELERINTSLQDEHQRLLDTQLALVLMEKSDIQSQKELKQLGLEIQCSVDKLKDVELRNTGLEEQIHNIKDENSALSKHNLSSTVQIKVLGDEISTLNQIKQKLVDEQKLLQHNFDHLNEDKKELEKKHQYLTAQLEVVTLNADSLHASLKKLQDEHRELQDICKSYEDDKLLLKENLKSMENISEKNTVMESSLADAHDELQELRMKIMALEDSCEALHGEVSTHVTEKSVLISQVETIAQSMEKLMEENAFLEKSSSEVKIEAEGLRRTLIELEDSFQSLCAQKESLVAERCTLASQVDSTSQSLESMENRHAELEVRHLNLERENNLRIQELLELESLLKLEKERHETLVQSNRNHVSTLESHILVVQEENQVLKEQDEVEQQKVMSAQFELLILHSSLSDLSKMILSLSKDCQKHLEASTCAEKLVSKLQEEASVQMEKMSSLLAHNEKVKEGMILLLTALNKDRGSVAREKDEVLLEIILGEIRNLLNSILVSQDAVQLLQLEMSVIVTLLEQTGMQVKDLGIKRQLLEEEAEIRKDEVLVLQCNKQELLERNEQLMQDMQISCYREEEMKFALGALQWQLSDLQDAQRASQTEIHEILDENQSLSRAIQSLRDKKEALEEENSAAIAEAMTLDHLYLLFRSFSIERAFELKLLSDDAYHLSAINSKLDWEIRQMNQNMSVVEMENIHLKESVACMEEYKNCLVVLQFDLHTSNYYCKQLVDEVEAGNSSLMDKEMELSETNVKVESVQRKNAELSRSLECLNEDFSKAMMLGEELQNKNFSLSQVIAYKEKEIERIGEVNALLYGKLQIVSTEVEMIRSREEQLTYRLQKGIEEVDQCEGEIIRLLTDTQYSTVSAAILEEKVFELLLESESLGISAMLQTEVLSEEIHSRSAYARDLKEKLDDLEGENRELKAHLDAYLPLVMSLQDGIASLGKQTLSLARHRASIEKESQDNSMEEHVHHDADPLVDDLITVVPAGVKELKKLTAKLGELQKVITDTAALLEKERINHDSDLEDARKEIREMRISKGIITQTENDEQHGADLNLHKDDPENSIMKHVQMMKDIQLDQVSSSPYGNVPSHDLTRTEKSGTDDQMLELWEAAERACDGRMKRAPQVVLEHDIEAVEEEKSEYPSSELVGEKELSIDRFEVSSEFGQSHQEWSRKATERLASNAQRLSILQTSIKEMEGKMTNYEKSKIPKSLTYDAIKEKLKVDEGAVLELNDINSNLTKKTEDFLASCDGTSGAQEETERKGRMRISIRAQRLSEKIGKLELEQQKTQYILLKLEEEHSTERAKTTDRRSKTILSDYVHERRNAAKQKKRSCCACIKPKTDSD